MLPTPLIKAYSPEHREDVLKIFRLNIPAYFSAEEEAGLKRYLDQEIETYYVLEVDGRIIGSGGINLSDDKFAGIISWDMVHPEYQSKGFGRLLLEHRINVIKTFPDVRKIIVRTSQHADKFYEKAGFELVEIAEDYWAEGFDLYKMEIKLG